VAHTLSIFIDSLIVLSVAAFVFTSITLWYMFVDKFHRWEREKKKREREREREVNSIISI
jgi:NADH:ubiquinone oxidoreductase subunit 5 (subunit L)/multisubunit Na+/H+ antiporter MnhA subunit